MPIISVRVYVDVLVIETKHVRQSIRIIIILERKTINGSNDCNRSKFLLTLTDISASFQAYGNIGKYVLA
jgi:uncharacterized protein YqiB (DUF1249 family)